MNSSQAAAPGTSAHPAASTAVHIGFVVNGVITVLLAPILPALSAAWRLQDAQLGSLFTAQFLGSLTGTMLSGAIVPRWGFRASLAPGYLLMASGVVALSFAGWPAGLACVFLYGIGIGLSIPASNVFVADNMPHRRAAALSILNFAWTAGAIACPWMFAAARTAANSGMVLRALAVLLVLVAAWMLRVEWPAPVRHLRGSLLGFAGAGRLLAILGALSFLYIGTESAVAGWIASYSLRVGGTRGFAWVVTPSFFFAALLLGRLGTPAVLRRVSEAALIRIGLVVATLGMLIVTASGGLSGVIAGVTIAGFGLAAVFPLLLAFMAQEFGAGSPRAASAMFALGGIGGATLPWLVGVLSTASGSLKAGLVVTVAAGAAMLLLHTFALPALSPKRL